MISVLQITPITASDEENHNTEVNQSSIDMMRTTIKEQQHVQASKKFGTNKGSYQNVRYNTYASTQLQDFRVYCVPPMLPTPNAKRPGPVDAHSMTDLTEHYGGQMPSTLANYLALHDALYCANIF